MGQGEDVKVIVQAFEFWCSISDEEVIRITNGSNCLHYCNAFKKDLFEIIKYHFINRLNAGYDEEDTWNPTKASSVLLNNLCNCCDQELISLAVSFIGDFIKDDHDKLRDSALLAYGSVLESTYSNISNIVVDSINILFEMIVNDKSLSVRTTSAWCVEKLAQHHSAVLYADANSFNKFYDSIITTLQTYPESKIAINLINAIHFVALGSSEHWGITTGECPISKYVKDTCFMLLNFAFSDNAYSSDGECIAKSSLYALGTIAESVPNENNMYLAEVFTEVMTKFTLICDNQNIEIKMKKDFEAWLASLFASFLSTERLKLTYDQAHFVLQYIFKTFVDRNEIYEEGIIGIGSIAISKNIFLIKF